MTTDMKTKLKTVKKAKVQSPLEKANKAKNYRLKSKYGITLEIYNQMLAAQKGVCALCEQPPKNKALSVDHLHKKDAKGKQVKGDASLVRGLLCFYCNHKIIGSLERRKKVSVYTLMGNLIEYCLRNVMHGLEISDG